MIWFCWMGPLKNMQHPFLSLTFQRVPICLGVRCQSTNFRPFRFASPILSLGKSAQSWFVKSNRILSALQTSSQTDRRTDWQTYRNVQILEQFWNRPGTRAIQRMSHMIVVIIVTWSEWLRARQFDSNFSASYSLQFNSSCYIST